MADERIDIEVVDKVAKTIKPELLGISAAAKNAYTQIAKLKREMGVTGGAGMGASMKAVASAERDATRASRERATQAQATARALDKEAAAAARLAAVAAKASTRGVTAGSGANIGGMAGSRSDAAAATAAMRQTSAAAKQTSASLREEAQALGEVSERARRLKASVDPLWAAQERLNDELREASTLLKMNAISQNTYNSAVDRANNRFNTFNQQLKGAGANAGLARHHMLNLGFQIQDIFVSLASGQKPLTVFIQQGGQIGQIAAQAGVGMRAMALAAGVMLVPFLPLIAAIGTAVGAFALLNKQINQDAGIKKYSEGLGLTAKEMKKLEGVTVTWGDTAKAIFQVTGRAIWSVIGDATSKAWNSIKEWFEKTIAADKKTVNFIIGSFVGAYRTIVATWRMFPAALGDLFISAVNKAIEGINFLVQKSIEGINWIADQANKILPEALQLPHLTAGQIGAVSNQWAGAASQVADAWKGEMDKALSVDYVGNAYKAILDQATLNAQKRLDAQAKKIIEDRGAGKKGGKPEADKGAEAILKLNADLKREAALLSQHLVGMDATVAERMASIEESLHSAGVEIRDQAGNWTEYGKAVFDAVSEAERNKAINAELNRIYGETKGVIDNAKIAQEALNIARKRGYITAEELLRRQNLLNESIAKASDPLRDYKQGIADQTKLLGFYGRELEIQTLAQQKFNEAVALGLAKQGDSIDPFVKQARQETSAKDKQGFLGELESAGLQKTGQDVGGNQWILENYKELYAEIDAMRKGDVESERNAAAAKRELDERLMTAKLANTERMLGTLSQLQNSSVKELAAIGKGAAIAQATIDAYRAINSILADPTLPAPVKIPLSIATGVTAFANVAAIAGVGFQKGGYTGDMPAHAPVGAVHGREYVMDAATTARIGVPALDALRSGRLNPGPANDNRGAKVTIINNAGVEVTTRERSDGELEFIIDRRLQSKFGDTMRREMSQPNSKTSQAVSANLKVRRNR